MKFIRTEVAFTRGVNSLFLCTLCLAPNNQQARIQHQPVFRSTSQSRNTYKAAMAEKTKVGAENVLKQHSLRMVQVNILSYNIL